MRLSLIIWDVQHGSAAYLRTPNGKHIVYDLGVGRTRNGGVPFSPLRHLYYNMGVRQLDEVVITHPHRDHLDDIVNFDLLSPRAFQRVSHLAEAEIRAGNQRYDAPIIDRYLQIHRRYDRILAPNEIPESPDNNGGVSFNSFHPFNCATANLNNHSIVTFMTYAGTTICLPGDNEAASWNELLENPQFRICLAQTNILVAAHHGREAGYCENIFNDGLCSPSLVVVSDGPLSDTSAVDKYRSKASGWGVDSRSSGTREQRWVLTTRCDGFIMIECYPENGANYLEVSID